MSYTELTLFQDLKIVIESAADTFVAHYLYDPDCLLLGIGTT